MLTLKQLCDSALEEIGFSKPSSYIGSSDKTALQMVRLAQAQGNQLATENPPWNDLIKEGTITLASGDQDYALPSDFRWIKPDSVWNQSDQHRTTGPLTSSEWQYLKNWGTVQGLFFEWRIRNSEMEFIQTIGSSENGEVIVFDYVSKNWAIDGTDDTTELAKFEADDDYTVFDDELFILGLKWRFLKQKGFNWEEDFSLYTRHLSQEKARDGGMRVVRMGATMQLGVNIPQDGFG